MSAYLEGLNPAQREAVTHASGPLLIVAGAGTGKTTVLARRYAWLLTEKGLRSDRILSLTFTEKAAGEMEDRVLQLLPNGTYDFWISTFHGFCQRVLEEQALEIGLPNRFRVVSATDAWLLLKRRLNELPLDHYRPLGNPVKFLAGLLTHISRAKDEGVTAEQYLAFAKDAALDSDAEGAVSLGEGFVESERRRLQELADCYFAYQRILREEGCLDFGDLIVETLRLLRERPAVLAEFRSRFAAIMVDEFQDTNWAQYELVKLLAGADRNLTVVGDDDQAIYKFRGASLANILQFRDDFPDAKTVALTENYRSRQEVLDVAYRFIKRNDPNRLEVTLADTGLCKGLTAMRGARGSVRAIWHRTIEEEVEAVARAIKNLKASDPSLTWNDVAILVRSNDAAAPFVRGLGRHGIPFRFFALRGLYAKPIVIDILSVLNACLAPFESPHLWRAMTAPPFGFSGRDIAELIQHANRKSVPLWTALKHARALPGQGEDAIRRVETFTSHIEALGETAMREPPLRVFQRALDRTGFLSHVLRRPESEKIEAVNLLNAFADRIKRYESSVHAPTLREFLAELALEIESGEEGALDADPDEGPELVKVMTIHASKGLEFRHVFVVSVVDQRFPTRARRDPIPLPDGLVNERLPQGDAHLEEERRLMYVAMTRAKDTLTVSGAENVGGARKKKPSVFFAEADLAPEPAASPDHGILSLAPAEPAREAEADMLGHFPLKRRFSFTQLAAFRSCPLQYKFAHVYRIPILGSHHKSFGQAMHLTFHDVLGLHRARGMAVQSSLFAPAACGAVPKDGFRVSADEALELFEARWNENDLWYPDRKSYDEYHAKGREAARRMVERWTVTPPSIFALEQSFDWKIGERSIKGSVDRIDSLPDGTVALFDYKTGSPKSAEDLEAKDKEQLRIYQLAMEARGMRVGRLAYVYVLDGGEAEVEPLAGDAANAFIADIGSRMEEILASRFPPRAEPHVCRFCDFRGVCEFRKM